MIIIYAADVGSIKKGNFAWARLVTTTGQINTDSSIQSLVDSINLDIAQSNKVCLGFECPLFINLPSDPVVLTSARVGEGSRAWSAGAGSGSLTTGLAEVLWVLHELKQKSIGSILATFEVSDLLDGNSNLDSIIAAQKFFDKLNSGIMQPDVTVERPYSLAGAALLYSGITNNIEILKKQCIVVKA